MKVILAGGGTGGHIYPAIAIADKIRENLPGAEILFVGTKKGLESRLVPEAGYPIEYITVQGFDRKHMLNNAKTAGELAIGMAQARRIVRRFKPDVVIGTGGYVCGPVVREGAKAGARCFIQEQNAFPGVTNKMLEKHVEKVFLGFKDGGSYFKQPEKHVFTGNPVRDAFFKANIMESREELGIAEDDFVILSFGGSRGAGRINKAMLDVVREFNGVDKVKVFFGTGDMYYDTILDTFKDEEIELADNIKIMEYINRMDLYLPAADVVISRGGALSLAEITVCGKCAILVPSPNVTANHQYYNAMALANAGGAIVIEEKELTDSGLIVRLLELKDNPEKVAMMGTSTRKCALTNSTDVIYHEILR